MKQLLKQILSIALWYSAIVWILKPEADCIVIILVIVAAQIMDEFLTIKSNTK